MTLFVLIGDLSFQTPKGTGIDNPKASSSLEPMVKQVIWKNPNNRYI